MKKTIADVEVEGKRVFLRVDFNVPINSDFKIANENRIVEALPTINYLLQHGAKVILCSHLGRPEGVVDTKLSLKPVLCRLQTLLNMPITFVEDIYDENTQKVINNMENGSVVMLENIRFLPGEV